MSSELGRSKGKRGKIDYLGESRKPKLPERKRRHEDALRLKSDGRRRTAAVPASTCWGQRLNTQRLTN